MSVETASLLVSSGNGPGECRQAVANVLARISDEAQAAGIAVDIAERAARDGPSSAVLILRGRGAEVLRAAWLGAIQWRCQSNLRPRHKRKNWFVQVFALPSVDVSVRINPDTVEMRAIRAGGPGGQHQNKTASAVRARWRSDGGQTYGVVVRDQRSQHQNRRIALERLQALVAADCAEAEEAGKKQARQLHHELQRGDPRRVFTGVDFRPTT